MFSAESQLRDSSAGECSFDSICQVFVSESQLLDVAFVGWSVSARQPLPQDRDGATRVHTTAGILFPVPSVS